MTVLRPNILNNLGVGGLGNKKKESGSGGSDRFLRWGYLKLKKKSSIKNIFVTFYFVVSAGHPGCFIQYFDAEF